MTAQTYRVLQTKLEQEENGEDVTDNNVGFQIWYQRKHLDGGQEILRWCWWLVVARLFLKVHREGWSWVDAEFNSPRGCYSDSVTYKQCVTSPTQLYRLTNLEKWGIGRVTTFSLYCTRFLQDWPTTELSRRYLVPALQHDAADCQF